MQQEQKVTNQKKLRDGSREFEKEAGKKEDEWREDERREDETTKK